jgi:hypothetical protein
MSHSRQGLDGRSYERLGGGSGLSARASSAARAVNRAAFKVLSMSGKSTRSSVTDVAFEQAAETVKIVER